MSYFVKKVAEMDSGIYSVKSPQPTRLAGQVDPHLPVVDGEVGHREHIDLVKASSASPAAS